MELSNVTAADYPPGYLDEYQGGKLLAVAITFVPLQLLVVGLRFYSRWLGRVKWGADDTLIIPGTIFCIALCVCSIGSVVHGGIGYHLARHYLAGPEDVVMWLKYSLALTMFYLIAVVFPKLAILAMYLRIFARATYRTVSYVVASVIIGNWIGTTVAGFFMCGPFEVIWDRTIPGGKCFDVATYMKWASLANIITDVVMLVLPIPVIWNMQTTTSTKVGLTFTFATGSLGLITSIIRFAGFYSQDIDPDSSWTAVHLLIWSIVEAGTYLIAACLTTYRPLAVRLWRIAPLSLSRSRCKTPQSQTRKPSQSIPLAQQHKAISTWLDDDSKTLVRAHDEENATTMSATGHTHLGSHAILVVNEYDVDSRST